jgi:hypothetical protein
LSQPSAAKYIYNPAQLMEKSNMHVCDLTTGMKKLEQSMQSLRTTAAQVEQYWSDEANRKFQETYLVPLEPKVHNLLGSIQRLADLLASAERECGIN